MRILQLIDYLAPLGGMKRFVYDLSAQLAGSGDDTLVGAFDSDGGEGWSDSPVPAAVLREEESSWLRLAREYRPDAVLWHCGSRTAGVAEKLADHYPLVSVVHTPPCPAGTRLFRDRDEICTRAVGAACMVHWYARRCGVRPEPWAMLRGMRDARAMRRVVGRSRIVYAVSDALKRMLETEGLPPGRIRVFDNTLGGVRERMPALRPAEGDRPVRLLYVGRLVYVKGVQDLLRAVRLLADRGVPATATIAGEGWYRDELERLARRLGVEGRVRFAGQVPGRETDWYYEQADVVVVPSLWPEPAGLVVPEARRRGKPVVVYDAGGLKEWSRYMDGIRVVPHKDVDRLADAIAGWREAAAKEREPEADGRVDLLRDLRELLDPDTRKEETS